MIKKEKLRSEIELKYKWNLNRFYQDMEAWEKDFEKLNQLYPKIKQYENHILDTPTHLFECLKLKMEISDMAQRLYCYVNMNLDVDVKNEENAELVSKILNMYEKINIAESFVIPEILKSDFEKVENLIKEDERLEEYRHFLKSIFREKKHILTSEGEQVLTSVSSLSENFKTGSEFIRNVELDFGTIVDEDGNKVELTASNSSKYSVSSNRNVRKQVYDSFNAAYEKTIRSLSTNYIGHVKYDEFEAKMRNHESAIEQDFFALNINRSVYDHLIKAGNESTEVYQKYLNLVKTVLNVDTLEPYDLPAPLVGKAEKEYTYEEAQEKLLDIFKIYGDRYIKILNEMFNNQWVDIMPSKNKKTGWYAWGAYGCHPVVFGNYQSKVADVSALAHELGHAVNFYETFENEPLQYADHSLFTAEVASLTNEIVFNKILLEQTDDKKEKLQILNNLIDLYVSNFYGSIKGAQFEEKIHTLAREGNALSASVLCEEWKKIVQKYNGDLLKPKYNNGWARIPHFFVSFYYYKYATGISAANYAAKRILEGNETFIQNYLEFLKIGTSKDPLEVFEIIGVDMANEKVYEETIDMFDQLLDKFMEVYTS